jgi:hypothetical protein
MGGLCSPDQVDSKTLAAAPRVASRAEFKTALARVWVVTQASRERGPRRHTATDFHAVENVPGLYAWYVDAPLSLRDLASNSESGVDAGDWLLQGLRRFASYFAQPPIEMRGRSDYNRLWTAEVTAHGLESAQSDPTSSLGVGTELARASQDPLQRQVIVEILDMAVPAFALPVYIGVASRLRIRLEQHLAKYDQAVQDLRGLPREQRQSLITESSDFGARLAAADIPLDAVSVWVLPYDQDSDDSPERVRQGLQAAEWVLQRVYRPPLGRR